MLLGIEEVEVKLKTLVLEHTRGLGKVRFVYHIIMSLVQPPSHHKDKDVLSSSAFFLLTLSRYWKRVLT